MANRARAKRVLAELWALGPVAAPRAVARWLRGGPLIPPARVDPEFLATTSADPGNRVTVIVAVHNERRFLDDCLESVKRQSWQNWECIVIDDASTDGGAEAAMRRHGGDPRFRFVFTEANLGLAGARNLGLSLAKGAFVTFLDGDDFLYPDALASRVQELLEHTDEPWVVGSYCNWHSVPEDQTRVDHAPAVPLRWPVHWLSCRLGAPFIASAPLLRVGPVRAAGGFDESLRTAEDFEFWSRLLRLGFVVMPVEYNGIAYRQKRQSMFRDDPTGHAKATVRTIKANDRAMPDQHVFSAPAFEWEEQVTAAERWIIALTGAVDRGQGVDGVVADLTEMWQPELSVAVAPRTVVRSAARRLARHEADGLDERAEELAEATMRVLDPVVEQGLQQLRSLIPVDADQRPGSRHREAVVRPRREADSPLPEHGIVLIPSSAYHLDELGPLAEELASRGETPVFMVTDRGWASCQSELWKYPAESYKWREAGPWLDTINAVVTMNDWGPETAALIEDANGRGVATFGRIEGVQDFEDVDVHWKRDPYRRVTHVLAQGPNDMRAPVAERRHLVGNGRLERIRAQGPTHSPDGPVIVNLNFTYHVLEEHREAWLGSVVDAIRSTGRPFLISRHPAEKTPLPGLPVSEDPMRHLLKGASLLISRFSTVPFEAMARGVPFVYHNPHGEKVPTFHQPNGAFPVTRNTEELAEAIEAWAPSDNYRAVSQTFFDAQVDISDEPSEVRTAKAIIEAIDG